MENDASLEIFLFLFRKKKTGKESPNIGRDKPHDPSSPKSRSTVTLKMSCYRELKLLNPKNISNGLIN